MYLYCNALKNVERGEPSIYGDCHTSNQSSRTTVDSEGNLYLANKASGNQGSITKILNNCEEGSRDYTDNGKIERIATSLTAEKIAEDVMDDNVEITEQTLHIIKTDGTLWSYYPEVEQVGTYTDWINIDGFRNQYSGEEFIYGIRAGGIVWDINNDIQVGTDTGWTHIQLTTGWTHIQTNDIYDVVFYGIRNDILWRNDTQIGTDTGWTHFHVNIYENGGCGIIGTNEKNLSCFSNNNVFSGFVSQPANNQDGNWIDVNVGSYHACGIKEDNSLNCWGYRGSIPQQLSTHVDWTDILVYVGTNCGIQGGNLWCWGSYFGSSPRQIDTHTNWKSIPSFIASRGQGSGQLSAYSACGIKNDNSLWCFGESSVISILIFYPDIRANVWTRVQEYQAEKDP